MPITIKLENDLAHIQWFYGELFHVAFQCTRENPKLFLAILSDIILQKKSLTEYVRFRNCLFQLTDLQFIDSNIPVYFASAKYSNKVYMFYIKIMFSFTAKMLFKLTSKN